MIQINVKVVVFSFGQMEAIESLIWLTEAAPAELNGIEIPVTEVHSLGCVPDGDRQW